jgi:ATP-dependent 26S proteasome regulatory subunit
MFEKVFGKDDNLENTLDEINRVISKLEVAEKDCNNFVESGDLDRARKYLTKIAELHDNLNDLAEKYFIFLNNEGNVQTALEEVEKLQKIIKNAESYFGIDSDNEIKNANLLLYEISKGDCLFKLKKYRRALKSFQTILELNDSQDSVWVYKGQILLEMKKRNEALEAFETAINLNWHNTDAWIGKGESLFLSDNINGAIEAFDTALEIDENNVRAQNYKMIANSELNSKLVKNIDSNDNKPQRSGKKEFKRPVEQRKDTTPRGFESVAGMLELKEILTRDVIKPLKNPEKYKKFNVTIPNGILLYGPPGCGKTFIVEKLAEEVGYNFMDVPLSKIGSKYIHETSDNIAKIFTEAKDNAPTILFFDEFEALVPKRESLGSEAQYKTEEINEFLKHLNNASSQKILVVGATNQPDLIDRAVMRAGRIDKVILVPPPDKEARKELFKTRLSKVPHSKTINFEQLAEKTENYSSSDITALIETAGRMAGDQDLDEINEELMLYVIDKSKPSISKSQIESFKAFSHLERK